MWTEKDDALHASLTFDDFVEAFGFMTQAAIVVESVGHHPEWSNIYNQVEIRLTTHDAGNIVTEKDRALAKELERLYRRVKGN